MKSPRTYSIAGERALAASNVQRSLAVRGLGVEEQRVVVEVVVPEAVAHAAAIAVIGPTRASSS